MEDFDLITGAPASTPSNIPDAQELWVDKYAGHDLEGIILPQELETTIRTALQFNSFGNYILYSGSPGTGKTSLAKAIPQMLGSDWEFVWAKRDSEIIARIDETGIYRSSNGRPKFFVIDEADFPSNPESFYRKLQSCVEATSSNLRFILTCNELFRIPQAIQSRCLPIKFDHPSNDIEYKKRIGKHLLKIAKAETAPHGGTVDKHTVVELVQVCFPDIRKMINSMHLTFLKNQGSIIGHPVVIKEETIQALYAYVIALDPRRCRYYISANVTEFQAVYVPFGRYFMERIPLPPQGQVDYLYLKFASLLGKAIRGARDQVNQEVALQEFLCDTMDLIIQCGMVGQMLRDPVQLPFNPEAPDVPV